MKQIFTNKKVFQKQRQKCSTKKDKKDQINSLYKIFKLKKLFLKEKLVTVKALFFVLSLFLLRGQFLKCLLDRRTLNLSFLGKQFQKYIFWDSSSEAVSVRGHFLKCII